MTDFIETYDNAISKEFCEALIKKFEKSDKKHQGTTGHGVNIKAKHSQDITIDLYKEWENDYRQIAQATLDHLVLYMRKYVYMLVGALTLSFPDPYSGEMVPITPEVVNMLGDDTVKSLIMKLYRLGTINLQKYDKGVGNYLHWHSENYPKAHDSQCDALHRTVLFMYYLNDVEEGGETDFFYQERKLKPKQGQLVIAPTSFTHTHRGNIPVSNDKYILTSWVLFQQAKSL